MYKVILIDDECLVIEGLKTMIDWHKYGFKIGGVANDGEAGFEMIKELQPDLVITDIRMPIINGLELIDMCRNQIAKEIRFAVLSGYSDFNYIRKALSLNSLTYILKPIDPDEIHKALKKIYENMNESDKESERLQQKINLILRATLIRLLQGEEKASIVGRGYFMLESSREDYYCYMWVPRDCTIDKTIDLLNNIQKKSEAFLKKNNYTHIKIKVFTLEDSGIGILIYGQGLDMDQNYTIAHELFETKIMDKVRDKIYISSYHKGIRALSIMQTQINKMKKMSFYYEEKNIYMYDIIKEFEFSKEVLLFDKHDILKHIKQDSKEVFLFYIKQLLREVKRKKLKPEMLECGFNGLMEKIKCEYDISRIIEKTDEPFYSYKEFSTYLLEKLSQIYTIIHKESYIDLVSRIKMYVEEKYNQDIRIKKMAEHFNYNAVYLGQLFYKNEGVRYSDYVLNLRLHHAKELLRYSNLKIKEIASQIGFKNPDYFVLKFKEIEGKSPSDYRL